MQVPETSGRGFLATQPRAKIEALHEIWDVPVDVNDTLKGVQHCTVRLLEYRLPRKGFAYVDPPKANGKQMFNMKWKKQKPQFGSIT